MLSRCRVAACRKLRFPEQTLQPRTHDHPCTVRIMAGGAAGCEERLTALDAPSVGPDRFAAGTGQLRHREERTAQRVPALRSMVRSCPRRLTARKYPADMPTSTKLRTPITVPMIFACS